MIAEVAILKRLSREHHWFDYLIDEELGEIPIGSLVKVPFRGSDQLGIVTGVKKSSPAGKLKSVAAVIINNFLDNRQLRLAKKISRHNGVSLGQTLNLFTPVRPNRRWQPPAPPKKSKRKQAGSKWLFTYYDGDNRLRHLQKLAAKVIGRGQQALILSPDMEHLRWLKKSFAKAQEWHSDLTPTQQQAVWSAIRSGQVLVILATRSGLFLPFANLGGILIDDSESENYKQSDQNPRYDGLEVAGWLQDIWHCSLGLFSVAPRLEDWERGKKKTWRIMNLGRADSGRILLIDQKNKPPSERFITSELTNAMVNCLSRGQKVFLYYNRRGSNTGVMCHDCGRMARCLDCGKTLVWHQDLGKLLCHTCNIKYSLPLPCPSCHGSNLHYLGSGLADMEKKLRTIFTHQKILRLDSDTNVDFLTLASFDIVLGTAQAWPLLNIHKFALVGVLSLESELTVPDFRAVEYTWARLRWLLGNSHGEVCIQTYNVDMEWLVFLTKDPPAFFNYVLTERRQFSWPPYTNLLRLSIKQFNQGQALKAAQQLVSPLQAKVRAGRGELVGPYPDYHLKERGKFVYHLLIKYPKTFNVEALWGDLPTDVIIDRHPRYVLS